VNELGVHVSSSGVRDQSSGHIAVLGACNKRHSKDLLLFSCVCVFVCLFWVSVVNFFVCDLERRKYIYASLGGLVDLVMATNIMVMDGKSLKAFVENDESWTTFVNQKFAALDKSHTGKLTRTELQPAVAAVGNAIGLPPMGESAETDHIYDEVINTQTDTHLGHLSIRLL
jgi:hypothetical protein